jgi:histone H2B
MVKNTPNTSKSVTGSGSTTNKPKRVHKKVRKPQKPQFNFKREIHRVLKQVYPKTSISTKSMSILNEMMADIFERLASESRTLIRKGKNTTLTSREMQTSAKLVLNGELCKHGASEAAKAFQKYVQGLKG